MKRIIFTLLYDQGNFVLSRNFRLQKVGNINWLLENYKFEDLSYSLDEILILNISRNNNNSSDFLRIINLISGLCFIPMTAGGLIKNFNDVQLYFKSGADKIFLNTSYHENLSLCKKVISIYGKQSIIAGIDFKKQNDEYIVYTNQGKIQTSIKLEEWVNTISKEIGAGEIMLQSIDRDGTSNGLENDKKILKIFEDIDNPLILMGGAGKYEHFWEVLNNKSIDAIATANLLNFIGDSFLEIKKKLIYDKLSTIDWDKDEILNLKNFFK